jgi:hypothetical protein
MIKANLVTLCNADTNEILTVCNINNNECTVSFKVNELSKDDQEKILAILNAHFSKICIQELANKLLNPNY